jgi:hypothetical protein
MKLTIYINGLIPNTRDTRTPGGNDGGTCVFVRATKPSQPDIEESATANESGEVELSIPDKYAGGKAILHIRHQWYVSADTTVDIPDFGVFYTVKINHDFSNWSESPSSDPEWNSEREFSIASNTKNIRLRNHRFLNYGTRATYYTILIAAPFSGLYLSGGKGVIFGLGVAVLLEVLAPYSIGIRHLFSR